jgi:hypothetical protein
MVAIGRNQSMDFSAGKPGSKTRPEKAPANAVNRNTGMMSDGKNVDGTRGISFKLRQTIAHTTLGEKDVVADRW